MTAQAIIGELMDIYLAGDRKMTIKEAREKAEKKFKTAEKYYEKCGFLTKGEK